MPAEKKNAIPIEQDAGAGPVPAAPRRAPCLPALRRPREPEQRECEDHEEDHELRAREGRDGARPRREQQPAPRRRHESARDEPQRERRRAGMRAAPRRRSASTRARAPRWRLRRPRARTRARRRVVRGRRRGRSSRSSRARAGASPWRTPRTSCRATRSARGSRRRACGIPYGIAAPGGLAGLGDRSRELRQLELVGEDRRHGPSGRLPCVERGQGEVEDQERKRSLQAGSPAPGSGAHGRTASAVSGGAVNSVRRFTILQGTPASAAAWTTSWSRSARRIGDRHEHLVGAGSGIARAASSSAPTTVMPWIRRRRTRGLSSRNPTTRASWVSWSSRARPRPARPAPTMRTRRPWRLARASGHEPRASAATRRRGSCSGRRRRRRPRPGKSPMSRSEMRMT